MTHIEKGNLNQSLVEADLQRRGFHVFISKGQVPLDIAAYKEGIFARVEVKSRRGKDKYQGPVSCISGGSHGDARLFDIRASVADDGTIVYQRSAFCERDTNLLVTELCGGNEEFNRNTPHNISKKG